MVPSDPGPVSHTPVKNTVPQATDSAFWLLFGATLAFFSALPYLNLAELVAIFEVAPLLITCLSFLILKEKVSWPRWVGVTIGLLGALIIIRPGTEVFTPYAFLPILAASCFAGYSITTRFLGSEESPWTNFLYTALIGTVIASVLVIPKWQPIVPEDLPILASFGIIGGIGHLMLIFALRYTQASILAPFSYFGLLYSSFWGFYVFDELPDFFTYLGAFVIVAQAFCLVSREQENRGCGDAGRLGSREKILSKLGCRSVSFGYLSCGWGFSVTTNPSVSNNREASQKWEASARPLR